MTPSRRFFLSTGIAASGLLAIDDATAAPGRERRRTFVLVHGAWESSGIWERVAHQLVAAGHAVVARDLPGFGLNAAFPQSYFQRPLDAAAFSAEPSPVANVTLEDNVDSVAGAIRDAVSGGSGPVILVGHSAGGISLTAVAERYPEAISDVVYLSAIMSDNDALPFVDVTSSENDDSKSFLAVGFGDPTKTGASRIDFNSSDAAYIANLQNYLAGDLDLTTFRALTNICTPDDPFQKYTLPTVKTAQRWGSIRRSYIRTAQDQAFLPALQDQWIAQADAFTPPNKTNVYSLDSSHFSFASQPDNLTAILLDIAGR